MDTILNIIYAIWFFILKPLGKILEFGFVSLLIILGIAALFTNPLLIIGIFLFGFLISAYYDNKEN